MYTSTRLFSEFNKNLNLTQAQITKMRKSRKAVETLLVNYFSKKTGYSTPKFWIQGSVSLGTIIESNDGTYDVDLGVYFSTIPPGTTSQQLQKEVYKAVENQTNFGAQHFKMCVRVVYVGDFDIDIPVYYMPERALHPSIAMKSEGFREDDPKELKDWFSSMRWKKDKHQIVRIVKYLKKWCNSLGFKTPSGAALTVWVGQYYLPGQEQDDLALLNVLQTLNNKLGSNLSCLCPVTPYDDLNSNLDSNQKKKFLDAMSIFLIDAKRALQEPNELKASKIWGKYFGEKFPIGKDINRAELLKNLTPIAESILAGTAKLDYKGNIQNASGIPHKKTTHYGGPKKIQ